MHEKKQTKEIQQQAAQAISLYYELIKHDLNGIAITNKEEKDNIQKWKAVHDELFTEIKKRHYSPKTLKAYSQWLRKFQTFSHHQDPHLLSSSDVRDFLQFLAVEQKVAVSTQNQALNALLFFYKHVIKKEFGDHSDVMKAKVKSSIPVILTRKEIDDIILYLPYPYDLIVKLLYGCGLRLSECLKLRINSFDFDNLILTVYNGEGKKDRTVPLPKTILSELKAQLERVEVLHQQDLQNSYDGAFMFDSLEKKYNKYAKDLIWQWFFPAKKLTHVSQRKEVKRYHLHETHVHRAIKKAVNKAQIDKPVSSYTFRHSFATHLIQAHYDIGTIQKLLGHRDIRNTMTYTKATQSLSKKEAKSPLDFKNKI